MISLFKKNTDEYSNVVSTKLFDKEARHVLKFESEIFARTLGPYGMNTVLEDRALQHRVTKDGYTVYSSVVVYNKIGRVVSRLIQKISSALNAVVGDGTTSSVIVANELYRLKKLIRKYNIPPKLLSGVVEVVSRQIVEAVKADAISLEDMIDKCREYLETEGISSDEKLKTMRETGYYTIVKNLAAISLNNNYTDGALVADMFVSLKDPANGFINPEVSRTSETRYELDRGFEIFRGMLLSEMVNQADNRTAEWNDADILLVKGDLMNEDVPAIGKVLNWTIGTRNRPLVIIANSFSNNMTETFRNSIINYAEQNHKIMPFLAIEIDTESSIGNQILLDIEANIGGQHIEVGNGRKFPNEEEPVMYQKYLGHAEKVVCRGSSWTRIIGGSRSPSKVSARVEEIDKILDQFKSEPSIDHQKEARQLNKRKACLLNDMVTMYVGGDTNEEKEARKDLFDDANRGCKSAMRNGVCRGGNTEVAHICHEILNDKSKIDAIVAATASDLHYGDIVTRSELERIVIAVLKEIKIAYTRVYAIVLNNKFRNWHKALKLATKCVEENLVYNLVSEEFENWDVPDKTFELEKKLVINSSETDTQILTAAVSIIDLLITSNQFIRTPKMSEMQKNA